MGVDGDGWQRKVAPCLNDAAACCVSLLIDDDRTLRCGGDEDVLDQYMDTITWEVLVVGLQEKIDHAIPAVVTETPD